MTPIEFLQSNGRAIFTLLSLFAGFVTPCVSTIHVLYWDRSSDGKVLGAISGFTVGAILLLLWREVLFLVLISLLPMVGIAINASLIFIVAKSKMAEAKKKSWVLIHGVLIVFLVILQAVWFKPWS